MKRRSRVIVLVVVMAAVLVGGTLIALSATQGGSERTAAAVPTAVAEQPLFAGIEQHGPVLGSPSAPVTLVEFADLQCPYCAEFARRALPEIVRDYVRTGRVKLVFEGLAFVGVDSKTALRAVVAAGLQNRAWPLLHALYASQGAENSGWVTRGLLRDLAGEVDGLNVARMFRQTRSSKVTMQIRAAEQLSHQAGVHGTPSFFVGASGAPLKPVQLSSLSATALRPALDAALATP